MQMKPVVAVVVLALGVVAGCATVGPGSTEGDVAPRIVTNYDKRNVWDSPGAFGPVPAGLQARGDTVCKDAGFQRASGYHSRAQSLDGRPFEGGGYFCSGD